MNTLSDQLLCVARRFAEATECDLNSASYRAFGDSRILQRLADGDASTTLRRADLALQWFSDHWPPETDWPDSVLRPASALAEADCPAS